MHLHRLVTVESDGGIEEVGFNRHRPYARAVREASRDVLKGAHESRMLSMDMDGVMIFDDNAKSLVETVAGGDALAKFDEYAGLNIEAVQEGATCFCWYAPTVFGAQVVQGLPPEVNREIGRNMRLIPGAVECISHLKKLGYEIVAVTAGHQEAAEEVSRRLGIVRTIGTELGVDEAGLYDGTVRRFVGGGYKLRVVEELLKKNGAFHGTHIGDSWSDVETLAGVPSSVAFNPGCGFALENAAISVLSYSLCGLLPLFDEQGSLEDGYSLSSLPKTVVIRHGRLNPSDSATLLKESRKIKKDGIRQVLEYEQSEHSVKMSICKGLDLSGINFRRKLDFMSPKEFDTYARAKFDEYSRTDF